MYKLDVERLQNEWNLSNFIPRSGRTTRMLVSAIQNVIAGQEVVVIGDSYKHCEHLMHETCHIALDMGYKVARPKATHLKIDNISLRFLPAEPHDRHKNKLRGRNCIVFQDHYVERI